MVDFKKLLSQTPEERAQIREKMDQEYAQEVQKTIDERTAMVRALHENTEGFTPDQSRFVDSLVRMAEDKDVYSRQVGGQLLTLSEKQVRYLNDLYRAQTPAKQETSPRAARFRSTG